MRRRTRNLKSLGSYETMNKMKNPKRFKRQSESGGSGADAIIQLTGEFCKVCLVWLTLMMCVK